MKIAGFHFLSLLTLVSAGICGVAEEETEDIISIADARARLAQPVKAPVTVRGRVTFCNEKMGVAFVQDETAGICFDPRGGVSLVAGDFVKVTGVVTKRRDMIMLYTSDQTPPVMAEPPEDFDIKPLFCDLDDAGKTHVDGLLTRVTGVVRSITPYPARKAMISVQISFPNGSATVMLPWAAPAAVRNQWLNSIVVCDAVLVCPAPASLAPRDVDALLLVPDKKSWIVRRDVLDSLFAQPPVESIGDITAVQRLNLNGLVSRRLHLSGLVTAASPKQWVCMRMGDRSVQVMTEQTERFEPGTHVSVACCPQMKRGGLVLLDGIFRKTGLEIGPVDPVRLRGGDADEASKLPMELVQVRGMLRNDPDWRGLPLLSLNAGSGTRFVVHWDAFLSKEQSATLASGSEVMLTGILKPLPKTSAEHAPGYELLPRSMQDVQVLRNPSWWTRSRLAAAAGWLTVIAGLGLTTTLVSRWQIRRQRKAVRDAETLSIAMEERCRIARELHDSLQQHLVGAALHVEALQGAVETVPQMLPQLLDETAAMIRHCQMEARHCIWDLRSAASDGEDISETLAAWLRMRSSQLDSMGLGFHQEGEVPVLGRDKSYQVLRIVQEAVNNAVKHAGAKQVTVRMKGSRDGLQVTVSDDGRGFDVNAALLRRQGHFGLRSQRERSVRIKGGLEFDSQLERGTRVTLRVAADPSPS